MRLFLQLLVSLMVIGVPAAGLTQFSGDTTIVENAFPDEEFATFFKRAPEHNGILQMISPRDGRLKATVEICQKGK